jgi:hypothetical protein
MARSKKTGRFIHKQIKVDTKNDKFIPIKFIDQPPPQQFICDYNISLAVFPLMLIAAKKARARQEILEAERDRENDSK